MDYSEKSTDKKKNLLYDIMQGVFPEYISLSGYEFDCTRSTIPLNELDPVQNLFKSFMGLLSRSNALFGILLLGTFFFINVKGCIQYSGQ